MKDNLKIEIIDDWDPVENEKKKKLEAGAEYKESKENEIEAIEEKSSDLESKNLQKISDSVVELCDKFKYEIMRCINCPIILECQFPREKLDPLKEEAKKVSEEIYEEEIELDNSAENVLRAQNKRDYIYNQYLKDNAFKQLENARCKFEKAEIINALQKFVDAGYDIVDPRVYTIVKELISNILNSGRANKAFTNLGLLLKKDTPAGPIYYQNPLLKTKIELSKIIVESTEALDRMLKTDETVKSESNFTSHLLTELKIREKKRRLMLDNIGKQKV